MTVGAEHFIGRTTLSALASEPVQTELWDNPSTPIPHTKIGQVRVDGLPVHLSKTDWKIERGGPCVGEHTEQVLHQLLGMSTDDVPA